MDLEWLAAVWVSVGRDGATLRGRARRSPLPRCWARQSQPSRVERGEARGLDVGRGGANPQGSSEVEFAYLGVSKSYSHTLYRSDESTLMVIISSSSGTLVLVPDSSLRTYGGVEYSFGGFSKWEYSEGFGLLL